MRHCSMFALRVLALSSMLTMAQANAAIIFESAPFVGSTSGGYSVGAQWIASRFHISETVAVSSVGGNVETLTGTLFAALIRLSGPDALPSSSPSTFSPIAVALFNSGSPSTDFRVPVQATLAPGDYALIFGSGRFGADGDGAMAPMCDDCPGSIFYGDLFSDAFYTLDPPLSGLRFVVEGNVQPTTVPEPATFILVAGGFLTAVLIRRLTSQPG